MENETSNHNGTEALNKALVIGCKIWRAVYFVMLFIFMFIPIIIVMILSIERSIILNEDLGHSSMHIFNRWLHKMGEFLDDKTYFFPKIKT